MYLIICCVLYQRKLLHMYHIFEKLLDELFHYISYGPSNEINLNKHYISYKINVDVK